MLHSSEVSTEFSSTLFVRCDLTGSWASQIEVSFIVTHNLIDKQLEELGDP